MPETQEKNETAKMPLNTGFYAIVGFIRVQEWLEFLIRNQQVSGSSPLAGFQQVIKVLTPTAGVALRHAVSF